MFFKKNYENLYNKLVNFLFFYKKIFKNNLFIYTLRIYISKF